MARISRPTPGRPSPLAGPGRRHKLHVFWPIDQTDPGPPRRRLVAADLPDHRRLGSVDGVSVATTIYPATGPGPADDVVCQRIHCPILGRHRGCWIEEPWKYTPPEEGAIADAGTLAPQKRADHDRR